MTDETRHAIELAQRIRGGTHGPLGRNRAEDGMTIISFARAIVELSQALAAKDKEEEAKQDEIEPQGKHCDDYIHDFTAPHCLRFFLLVNRLPAVDMVLCREFGVKPKLFATHEGDRVRVVMASRMGDVGITRQLDAEDGYQTRVMISDLADFGNAP